MSNQAIAAENAIDSSVAMSEGWSGAVDDTRISQAKALDPKMAAEGEIDSRR